MIRGSECNTEKAEELTSDWVKKDRGKQELAEYLNDATKMCVI